MSDLGAIAVAEHAIDRWVERVAPTASRDAAQAAILRYAATLPDGGRTRKGDRVLVGEHRGVAFGLVLRSGPPRKGRKADRRRHARTTVVTALGPVELAGDGLIEDPRADAPEEAAEDRAAEWRSPAPPEDPGPWRRAALALAAAAVDGEDIATAFAAAVREQPGLVDALAAERGLA